VIRSLSAQSLRRKLVIIALITTGLTLLVSNLAFISLEYYLSRQDTQKKLTVLGEVIANRATAALTFSDFALLRTNLNTLRADSSVVRGCIYAESQALAASYHPEDGATQCPEILQGLQNNQHSNFAQFFPILLDNNPIGTLYIEISHKDLLQRINQFLIY